MATVDISASSVLSEMSSIYTDARDMGLNVPKHINKNFRSTLATPAYREALEAARLDPVVIGNVLGNKHRWDQGLCKYFTLRFLEFYMKRTPRSTFDASVMTLQYAMPNAKDYTTLPAYDAASYGPRYVDEGPSLFYGNNRYLTLKIKTEYPNVSKGLDEYQLRWINMRYIKNIRTGAVTLQPVPAFKARRKAVGKSLETRGQISGQAGQIANFSYCALANAFKEICLISLDMLVGKAVPDTSSEPYIPFDIINLLEKRNTKFRIVTYGATELGPLFGSAGITVNSEHRINGDVGIYFLYGSSDDLQAIAEEMSVFQAYVADEFRLSQHNLYGDIDNGEPVQGLLFETEVAPTVITEQGVAIWDDAAQISAYELLDEGDIVESLGV